MKICAAQIKPFKGDIEKNIGLHLYAIEQAAKEQADIIIFPELSLTAYEPTLAKALAIDAGDKRLDAIQEKADEHDLIVTVGVPLKKDSAVCIGMIIFQPGKSRTVYTKAFLHPDEEPFFVKADGGKSIHIGEDSISFAICYEVFVREHNEAAIANGSNYYMASVAKSATGMIKAYTTLPGLAVKGNMLIVIANSVGYCDNFDSAGQSAIWNNQGEIIDHLGDNEQALLLVDTISGHAFTRSL